LPGGLRRGNRAALLAVLNGQASRKDGAKIAPPIERWRRLMPGQIARTGARQRRCEASRGRLRIFSTGRCMKTNLSVFIIACDEADRIGRTIASIKGLSADIVVVDSGPSDASDEVARALGPQPTRSTTTPMRWAARWRRPMRQEPWSSAWLTNRGVCRPQAVTNRAPATPAMSFRVVDVQADGDDVRCSQGFVGECLGLAQIR